MSDREMRCAGAKSMVARYAMKLLNWGNGAKRHPCYRLEPLAADIGLEGDSKFYLIIRVLEHSGVRSVGLADTQ